MSMDLKKDILDAARNAGYGKCSTKNKEWPDKDWLTEYAINYKPCRTGYASVRILFSNGNAIEYKKVNPNSIRYSDDKCLMFDTKDDSYIAVNMKNITLYRIKYQ